jgi:phosphate starvation-inducible PhoH-like protein
MNLRHTFLPPNNIRINHLCGPLDVHLRRIESSCSVAIAHRFEQFKIDGNAKDVHRALELLQALYEMAHRPISDEALNWMLLDSSQSMNAFLPPKTTRNDKSKSTSKDNTQDIFCIQARTRHQTEYLQAIAQSNVTFGIGPAGTGKTHLAVACAVDALNRHAVQKIILTRPAVEAGERLGFLPGDATQKINPYLRPLCDALYAIMGVDKTNKAFERQQIEVAPLAFMRGRTLSHAFVLLDEAQNTTPEQMKMFLTRLGVGSKAIITGDITQIDLPQGQASGLVDAERVLQRSPNIQICRFDDLDVVRHPVVTEILQAYTADRLATTALLKQT